MFHEATFNMMKLRLRECLPPAFHDALIMEERFLKQKAKIEWLKEGDSNSAYFHKAVKSRVSRSRIDVVTDANGVVFQNEKVADAFISHYEVFLGQPGITNDMDTNNLFQTRLTVDDALNVVRVISDQEVKEAIFSMGNDKSPGPDGYTVAFFKEAWDTVGSDVTYVVREFFVNGRLLKEINHTIIALIPKVKAPARIGWWLGNMEWLPTSLSISINGSHSRPYIKEKGVFARRPLYGGGVSKGKAKVSWEVVCLPKDEGGLGVRRLDHFNKALMISHIWKLLSLKESLWVQWIHAYKLKWRSFWDIPYHGTMSWGWRKILQLCPLVRDLSSTVRDAIRNGSWLWPHEWTVKYPLLNNISVPVLMAGKCDYLEWRDGAGAAGIGTVWSHLNQYAGMRSVGSSMQSIISYLIPLAKRKMTRSVIGKIVVAATAYFVWHEQIILNKARAEQNLAEPSVETNVKYELNEELLMELRRNTYCERVKEDVVIAKILEILDLIKMADMNEGDGKINTWEELVKQFFSKFYPLSCASNYDKMCDDDEEGRDPLEFITWRNSKFKDHKKVNKTTKCALLYSWIDVGNNEGIMDHTNLSMIAKPELKIGDEFLKILDNSFNGIDGSEFTDHISKVLEITEWIKIPNVDKDEHRLHMFSKLLSGEAEKWWNSEGTTTTWKELGDKFFHKYYPSSHTYKSKISDDLDHGTDYFEFLY
ncbi:hypothetical protein Tco_0425390 [Tanacetum coccineum]